MASNLELIGMGLVSQPNDEGNFGHTRPRAGIGPNQFDDLSNKSLEIFPPPGLAVPPVRWPAGDNQRLVTVTPNLSIKLCQICDTNCDPRSLTMSSGRPKYVKTWLDSILARANTEGKLAEE